MNYLEKIRSLREDHDITQEEIANYFRPHRMRVPGRNGHIYNGDYVLLNVSPFQSKLKRLAENRENVTDTAL